MLDHLLTRPRLLGGAALALAALGGVAVADGAATKAPSPQTGRWQGLPAADGVVPDVDFRVVRTSKGYELRDFKLVLPEQCADASGKLPPVDTTATVAAKRVRIGRSGRFSYTDNSEVSFSGRLTAARKIVGKGDAAPEGLTCSFGSGTFTAGPVAPLRTVTVRSSGRTVKLKVGDRLAVDLSENPSTGFSWRVTARPAPLDTVSSAFTAPEPQDPPIAGAPGRRVFLYDAARAGRGTLKLLSRRGSTASSDDTRLTVKVIVTG